MLTIPTTTNEYIHVPVTAWSGDITDPTTLPVDVAVIPVGSEPTPADYKPAAWVTANGTRKIRILWRTAVPTPTPGTIYSTWVRITANPETPVLLAGTIKTL